ncbi:MAG: NTP transferase domain-containing protein [Candidatus Omnitrophica bacterium]|nr:NTP transferase domain-containing protein [Candidatus Omnitrophota bacterium]
MSALTNTDIVILAGGLGRRLSAVTGGKQKVLARINGKPFLSLLIEYIASQGGRRFILCTGHGAGQVEEHIVGAHPELEILFSREEEPLGTGGAIKKGASLVNSDQFLAMNGDCFCVIDYNRLIEFHRACKAQATLAITRVEDAREYGTIEIDTHKHISAFKEKQPQAVSAFINTGTYCFDRNVFGLVVTPAKFSIEYDFFPHLVGHNFFAFEVENKFIDIGTPERYAWAQEHLKTLCRGSGPI